jgi:hypothetical protein
MRIAIWRQPNRTCTPGIMTIEGEYFGLTLELPWKDNRPRVSCIPSGEYSLAITDSFKFKRPMLLVQDVPGRAGIRVHNVNHWGELRGCIAVAAERPTPETIRKGLSQALQDRVRAALLRGEVVTLRTVDPVASEKGMA